VGGAGTGRCPPDLTVRACADALRRQRACGHRSVKSRPQRSISGTVDPLPAQMGMQLLNAALVLVLAPLALASACGATAAKTGAPLEHGQFSRSNDGPRTRSTCFQLAQSLAAVALAPGPASRSDSLYRDAKRKNSAFEIGRGVFSFREP